MFSDRNFKTDSLISKTRQQACWDSRKKLNFSREWKTSFWTICYIMVSNINRKSKKNQISTDPFTSIHKARISTPLSIPICFKIQEWVNLHRIWKKELEFLMSFLNMRNNHYLNFLVLLMRKCLLRLKIEKCGRRSSSFTTKNHSYGLRHTHIRNWLNRLLVHQRSLLVTWTGLSRISTICSTLPNAVDRHMVNSQSIWLTRWKRCVLNVLKSWDRFSKSVRS